MKEYLFKSFLKEHAFKDFIGNHSAFKKLVNNLNKIANNNLTVLIHGETGTGKGRCAEIIHQISDRNYEPFIPYNCGAGPDTLFDSQIFGHAKGAFTGAHKDRSGLVEEANKGVLFLDEINSLNSSAQVKLNYFLETSNYRRLGENRIRKSDVRIIAASNVDLRKEIVNGQFREDLFFRLTEYEISVPPLRLRKSDIPLLVQFFLKKYNHLNTNSKILFTPEILNQLIAHRWPGNIRELENVIKKSIIDTPTVVIRSLFHEENNKVHSELNNENDILYLPWKQAKKHSITLFERNYLISLLVKYSGIVTLCARHAQVQAPDFWKLMRKYNLQAKDYRINS